VCLVIKLPVVNMCGAHDRSVLSSVSEVYKHCTRLVQNVSTLIDVTKFTLKITDN